MCCKVYPIPILNKQEGKWCAHCAIGSGCRIHEDRPEQCRSFVCLWLQDVTAQAHGITQPRGSEIWPENATAGATWSIALRPLPAEQRKPCMFLVPLILQMFGRMMPNEADWIECVGCGKAMAAGDSMETLRDIRPRKTPR